MADDLLLRSPDMCTVKVTAPSAGYSKGQITKVEDMVGVIVDDTAAAATAVMIYKCPKIVVTKRAATTGLAFSVGDKVYYRSGGPDVTPASTGNTLCGRCTVAATSLATTVEIDLNGASQA